MAIELGLADRIEIHLQAPRDNSNGFFAVNPLARIPALETDDGMTLFDSPVICEYLNALAHGAFIPDAGPQRWEALRRQALGDGILDWALPLRAELLRSKPTQSPEVIERCIGAINRALDMAERDHGLVHGNVYDVGAVAIACALGWLDLRLPEIDWRGSRAALTEWFARVVQRPAFDLTRPA